MRAFSHLYAIARQPLKPQFCIGFVPAVLTSPGFASGMGNENACRHYRREHNTESSTRKIRNYKGRNGCYALQLNVKPVLPGRLILMGVSDIHIKRRYNLTYKYANSGVLLRLCLIAPRVSFAVAQLYRF